jgi:hypothetical protein
VAIRGRARHGLSRAHLREESSVRNSGEELKLIDAAKKVHLGHLSDGARAVDARRERVSVSGARGRAAIGIAAALTVALSSRAWNSPLVSRVSTFFCAFIAIADRALGRASCGLLNESAATTICASMA